MSANGTDPMKSVEFLQSAVTWSHVVPHPPSTQALPAVSVTKIKMLFFNPNGHFLSNV